MIIETGVFLCIIILYSGKAKQDGGIELKQCPVSTFDDLWHLFLIRSTHYSFGVKVHRNPVAGILNSFNYWILLKKIVEYLVDQTFYVYGLFRWRSYRK